ncbi:hypothetical protein ACFL2J_06650 [Candidatus Omnitrophota bacterium]
MNVLNQIVFKGTKFYHKHHVKIEFGKEENNWQVVVIWDGLKYPDASKVIYSGDSQQMAEQIFVTGFHTHFADDYICDVSDEMTKNNMLIMFNRVVESMFMRVLVNLGYDPNGKWEMKSFFKGIGEGKEVDEVNITMKRFDKDATGGLPERPKRF